MDIGQSTLSYVHRTLFQKKIFFVENLNTKNLGSVPVTANPYLIVTPLKIAGGSGSPVRVLLLPLLPKDSPLVKNKDSGAHNYTMNRNGWMTIILLIFSFAFSSLAVFLNMLVNMHA